MIKASPISASISRLSVSPDDGQIPLYYIKTETKQRQPYQISSNTKRAKMCQRLMERVVHRCQHVIDSPGSVIEYNGCGKCGTVQKTTWLAQTTKRDPCPDCIDNGVWIKVQGKWVKAT
ncbi:hypothetical protein O988_00154 [Pseudogymnoascus sp. VKM F-3808]|nr:hypothetical protein O988_00154 [Pseudogymnoascus sp. VKM F-3808]